MTTEAETGRQSLTGDCASAFLLLSRIPVTWHRFRDDQPPDFISSLWAFPLVGLVIGAAGGADDEADKRKGPERGDEIRRLVIPEAMPGHRYPAEQEKG